MHLINNKSLWNGQQQIEEGVSEKGSRKEREGEDKLIYASPYKIFLDNLKQYLQFKN